MFRRFETLLNDLFEDTNTPTLDDGELKVVTAALLVHCANADGERSAAENTTLQNILKQHFELSDSDIKDVVAAAEAQERDAVDLHRFTRVLHQRLDRDGRQRMVGWLWEIANADGTIDADEKRVVSLAAQLLDVEVRDSVALRQAAVGKDQPE